MTLSLLSGRTTFILPFITVFKFQLVEIDASKNSALVYQISCPVTTLGARARLMTMSPLFPCGKPCSKRTHNETSLTTTRTPKLRSSALISLSWIVVVVIAPLRALWTKSCKNGKKFQSATEFCRPVVYRSACVLEQGGFCFCGKNDPLPKY